MTLILRKLKPLYKLNTHELIKMQNIEHVSGVIIEHESFVLITPPVVIVHYSDAVNIDLYLT